MKKALLNVLVKIIKMVVKLRTLELSLFKLFLHK